jgi:thiol-disulfide isomerase/thioredoxin
MKKTALLIVTFFTIAYCSAKDKSYAIFSGTVKNSNETIIKIIKIDNSSIKEVSINESGYFRDTVYLDSPSLFFYQIGRSYTSVFLKNGYDLVVSINADDFYNSIKFSGEGSDVNNFHVARGLLKGELVGDAKTFFVVPVDDFINKIENNKNAFLSLLEKSNLTEEDKKLQAKIIYYDWLLTKNNYDKFYHFHTKQHPELPDDYYNPVKEIDLNDKELFNNDKNYRSLLTEHWRMTSKEAMENDSSLTMINFVKGMIENINSLPIKDHYSSMLLREMNKDNENLDQDYYEILSIFNDSELKQKLKTRYKSVNETKPTMASSSFNYENHKGGLTSLNDLKGKIIYIEIWATWCGPCIAEMPSLKGLIEHFKDENIEFVSISIDSKNDYEKWKKMVSTKNVGGIQLYADKGLESEFMKGFNVGLLPRSILLDQNGNIITPHAPRPSDPTTKQYLEEIVKRIKIQKL